MGDVERPWPTRFEVMDFVNPILVEPIDNLLVYIGKDDMESSVDQEGSYKAKSDASSTKVDRRA